MIILILKSLVLGFFFTLPLGPIGLLCSRKILQFGRLYGFILGLSQVLVIFIYSIITILSLGWFSDFLLKYQFWIRLIGGLALIGFGMKIFFARSFAITKQGISKKRFISDFFYIAGLMFVSPHSLLVFLVLFSSLQLYMATTFFEHLEIIFGIFIGSIISWALVCVCFIGYKKNATRKVMTWINRSAGIFLVVFGIAVCISAVLLVI
jgi:threonine/homoserine/homoserine lactone efflux protein